MLSVSLVLACGFMVAGCEDPATDQTAPKTNCVIEAAKAMPQTLSNGMTKTGVCTNCKCAIYKCAKGKEIYVCPETGVAKTKLADGTFAPWKCKKSGKARIVCPKTGKVTNAPE
ncbi:MAG: hypothetical protein HN370_04010 [Phycisphaerales bacterium]|nr:hypothetical protein [Phycisphaerales bacterium]